VTSLDKTSLRQQLRQHRRTLSATRQALAAQQISLRIMRTHWWRTATRIAFYWPADGEVSPLPLLRESLRSGKQCYLPVIEHKQLLFREFRRGGKLKRNRYNIPEPKGTTTCPADQLDVILLPLVAFDSQCNRLGMGAGFYDRTLASHSTRKPLRVGLAHELQKVAPLPTDPWDVPLHSIITDRRTYRAS
jgi:5-formyltetrahydrofolate cyclo-ligase